MDLIKSKSNSIIKELKSLHLKKYRYKYKKYFLEGIRSVNECLKSNSNIDYILFADSLFETNGGLNLFKDISKTNIRIFKTTNDIIKSVSDTNNPQGIIAVVKIKEYSIDSLINEDNNLIIILDRIQDPGNLGTIIRTCDAFDVDGVIISEGSADLYNPKTIRATMGSIFHIKTAFSKNIIEVVNYLKTKNISIMATALNDSIEISKVNLRNNIAIIIGNEANGVNEKLLNIVDKKIKIPMNGNAESLNAAIAASLVIYEANRQRQKI